MKKKEYETGLIRPVLNGQEKYPRILIMHKWAYKKLMEKQKKEQLTQTENREVNMMELELWQKNKK